MQLALFVVIVVFSLVLYVIIKQNIQIRRAEFIRKASFPPGLYKKLRQHHPHLTPKDCQLVGQALRQFFLAYLHGDCKFVAMPSQVVDDLWHEFILYTRHYKLFCQQAFGCFLHHTPAIMLGENRKDNSGLRCIWWFACKEENINPRYPFRLPLLFAVDNKFKIPNGFYYTADCQALTQHRSGLELTTIHCGEDFSSTQYDGTTDGFPEAERHHRLGEDGLDFDCGGSSCSGD
jgi:hypothetical protein